MADLKNIVGIDKSAFPCVNGFDPCSFKERTISYALFVGIPEQTVTPDAIFKECCYTHFVLASSTSSELYKNDFSGFYHKRQIPNETVEFIMVDLSDNQEYDLSSNYSEYKGFNQIKEQPDLSTVILNWKEVLEDLGEGSYKVLKRVVLAGVPLEIEYLVYNLLEYSTLRADNTIRLDCTMSGLLEKEGIDFSGSEFKDSLRVNGFFGNRDPAWEEDNIINRNYVKRQVSMKQTNQYRFQTNMVPDCITNQIIDFFLFSDDIRMNDYNLNNHSYNYINFSVKLLNNEGTRYIPQSRKAQLNLVFNDKIVNNNKRNF